MDRIDQKAIKVASAGITVYNVPTAVLRALWYKVVRAVLCTLQTDGRHGQTDKHINIDKTVTSLQINRDD